jgi:putative transposase
LNWRLALCDLPPENWSRVRYGIGVLRRREGWHVRSGRAGRIEKGLQLRHKSPERRIKAKLRNDRTTATYPDDICTMDFVHD